jgi:hypothetical protein
MKRNFTNENLEEFLRRSASGLRMRPSDKVWKEISKNLQRRKRRVGFAIGTLLLALGTLGYFTFENGIKPIRTISQTSQPAKPATTEKPSENDLSQQHQILAKSPKTALLSPSLSGNILTYAGKNTPVSADAITPLEPNSSVMVENPQDAAPEQFNPTIVDSYFDGQAAPSAEQGNQQAAGTHTSGNLPLTIESVINSYKAKTPGKRLAFQFYFTPTVSYRKLSENKSFLQSQPAINNPNYTPALIYDVNNVVTHKPNMGIELGLAMKYPLARKMKLRGGLQFNVNRYDIKAYNAITSVATIVLNGRSSNRADSLNALSRYSNATGYKSNWIENYYLQISAPVGVEFKLNNDKQVEFGIATTIQPTYVLGDRAYLISTNYKSYAEVPQLVRRWNVNTALETFVGYSTGKLNWQVGPQVRYQLLSSFINKYPVKENLFDFGLKVGISVNPNH